MSRGKLIAGFHDLIMIATVISRHDFEGLDLGLRKESRGATSYNALVGSDDQYRKAQLVVFDN